MDTPLEFICLGPLILSYLDKYYCVLGACAVYGKRVRGKRGNIKELWARNTTTECLMATAATTWNYIELPLLIRNNAKLIILSFLGDTFCTVFSWSEVSDLEDFWSFHYCCQATFCCHHCLHEWVPSNSLILNLPWHYRDLRHSHHLFLHFPYSWFSETDSKRSLFQLNLVVGWLRILRLYSVVLGKRSFYARALL